MKHVLILALLVVSGCSLDWTPPAVSAKDAGVDVSSRDVVSDARDGRSPSDERIAPIDSTARDTNPTDALPADAAVDVATRPDASSSPLVLVATNLPNATAGARYSFTFSAMGGAAPLRWAVDSGRLPNGITLDGATGTLSGTSTAVGSADFAIRVTDASTQSQVRSFALTVGAAIALSVVTTALPSAVVGQAYGQPVNASGGVAPYHWVVTSGALPAGLTLDADTGVIAGTPTAAGAAAFVLQVSDVSAPAQIASRSLSIAVVTPLSVVTTSLPSGVVGRSYSGTLVATGGTPPYQWSVSAGTLPAGLTLNAGTGALTGVPTSTGDSTVGISVRDASVQTAGVSLTVSVAGQLVVNTASLAVGKEATPYSVSLGTTGGRAPLSWLISSGTLPLGIALDATTGLLHGTPLAGTAGDYALLVAVTDAASPAQRATANLSLRILAPVSITTVTLPGATAGAAYKTTLSASGGLGPYLWSLVAGTAPTGISINQTGDIQGTPTAMGSYTFTVSASDSATPPGSAQRQFTIVVAAALALQPVTLPSGRTGQLYSATLTATGGTKPYRWQLTSGALPSGLTLNATTGQIAGTPIRAETASFKVRVSDANNSQVESAPLTIVVASSLTIVTTTLPVAVRGTTYSATLTASGGSAPYSWSLIAGTLPRNLTLQSNTGVISGSVSTRAQTGPTSITVQVRDSGIPQQQKTAVLTITVR